MLLSSPHVFDAGLSISYIPGALPSLIFEIVLFLEEDPPLLEDNDFSFGKEHGCFMNDNCMWLLWKRTIGFLVRTFVLLGKENVCLLREQEYVPFPGEDRLLAEEDNFPLPTKQIFLFQTNRKFFFQ